MNRLNLSDLHWMGRVEFQKDGVYFGYTGSGFLIQWAGKTVEFQFQVVTKFPKEEAYVQVILDEETKEHRFLSGNHTITIQKDDQVVHQLQLRKMNEASDNGILLTAVLLDGVLDLPRPLKRPLLEVIGASNTTGYGNLGSEGIPKSTTNSNGLLSFSILLEKLCDADIHVIGASGWGLLRGYNSLEVQDDLQTIPALYEISVLKPSNRIEEHQALASHDIHPTVVIINAGTNDFHSVSYQSMSEDIFQAYASLFLERYLLFVQTIKHYHPQSKILITYGIMNEGQQIIQTFHQLKDRCSQDESIQFLALPRAGESHPFGSDGHPNIQTHRDIAQAIADFIKHHQWI